MPPRNTFAASRRSHQILKWLQSGRAIKIQDVIDEFGIQYPQARADLKLLEELYGLATHRDGRVKVWTWSGIDPDYIDLATAASLELGAIAVDLFKGTPYGQEIESFAEQSREHLSDKLRGRVERLSKALHLRRTWLPTDEERVVDHIETIVDSLFVDDPRWLLGEYVKSGGTTKPYLLLPRRLIWYQGRLWTLALHGEDLKLFDVAGFRSLERYRPAEADLSGDEQRQAEGRAEGDRLPPIQRGPEELEAFLESLDDDPAEFFEDSFGIFAGDHFDHRQVHLEVDGPWVSYLNRYRLHPSQENEMNDGSLHVRFDLAVCPEFESFVMGMIPHVTIHAPDQLQERLEQRVRAWSATSADSSVDEREAEPQAVHAVEPQEAE